MFIWMLVAHFGQLKIREHHHYNVDVVVGIYMGILLWSTTSWIWSRKDRSQELRLKQLALVKGDIQKATKEGDLEKMRSMLNRVDKAGKEEKISDTTLYTFGGIIIFATLSLGLLAFTWTADG